MKPPLDAGTGRGAGAGGRRVVLRPVLQFAVLGLAVVAIVGVATAAASRRVGEREAVADARTTTLIKAQGLVEPVLTDGIVDGDPEAVAAVAAVVEDQVLDESLVRVRLWTADGTVVYSDAEDLQGEQYPLGDDELEALRSGLISAEVSDLSKPENRFEQPFGKLLEVYLPVRTPSGERLLFEAYYRYDAVSASGRDIWQSFAPISIGALVVVEVVQIPLAWSLASRLRHRQLERETLLRRAVEASDVERRRIASDLHDGVVQDLAGVSFELAGAARDPEVPPEAAALLDRASESVRANITALRSMLLDIYPPDLGEVGLTTALHELAADASNGDRTVTVEATGFDGTLTEAASRSLYRVAREALRNVVVHSHATRAVVAVGTDGTTAWVSVTDDGSGFDPADADERARQGHLGLRGLRDMLHDVGGSMEVETRPGAGTTVRAEVPAR